MKGSGDSNASVPIVVGVLALLAAGIALRQCGSTRSAETATAPQLAAMGRHADKERGGWIAQSQPRFDGAGTEGNRPAGGSGRMADRRSAATADRGAASSEFAPPGGSGGARDGGERDFRDTDTVDAGGDDIPAPPRAAPANAAGAARGGEGATNAPGNFAGNSAAAPQPGAAQPPGVKPSSAAAGTSQTQPVADAKDPANAAVAEGSGPVLSLPLDNSTEPDKSGDGAPIIASGVTFDANGAHFSAGAQLFIPSEGNVNSAAGTFTFWMLPDWAGDVDSVLQILHLGATNSWSNRLDIFKDHPYLRLLMCPDSGYESGADRNISGWKKGERHMITATWGDGVVAMYIDGLSVGEHDYDGELDIGSSPPLFLGAGNPRVKEGANSNITNFQMYTRALSAEEVAALYAQPPP